MKMRGLKYFLVGVGAVTLLVLLFHQALLRRVGHLVYYEDGDFTQADAVVVLAGGVPDRAFQAADLLRESRARRAILFQEALSRNRRKLEDLGVDHPEDHEINQEVLIKLGVEADRIQVLPERVDSTWREALALRRYLADQAVESIVLTTCRYHSYRAFLNFQKALEGTGLKIYSVPTRYCEFDPDAWWRDRDQIKSLYLELAGLTAFFLGRR